MSTVSQVRPGPAGKYESFVEEQLTRARQRIRLLDLAAAGLGFLVGTLGYGLVMVVLDRLLDLPSLARQAAFGLYLVGAVVYLGLALGRVLFRRINPLYAAKQVEQTLPGAKNSVVNYLDLRDQELPAAIRSAVSHRAAKDLARADLDQAISTRRTGWLGGILGGLCLAMAVLFFLGPPQFFSLLRRAFAPFTETTIATRTQIGIMQPEGGHCTVAVGRAVPVLVSVFGHIPESNRADSLRLLYRHQPNDPYTERPLERGDSRNEWGTVVPAAEVQTGFWYKVAGGDAETPEYRVRVRSNPLVESVEVTYHYRPYLNRPDRTTNDPNLEALRGTEVTVTARTNRALREGHLEFVGEAGSLTAEKVADEPRALRARFTPDKDGSYRIWFTSQEGERNTEPMPYTIRVKTDNPPRVEVTKVEPPPAAAADKGAGPKDNDRVVELPANGLLRVEGVARDDYGVAGMKLRAEGDVQFARTYREGKSFQLENGNYPLKLDYKDFVDLGRVKLANGQPLHAGVEFECWLEATDNCDYPEANVGRSERFKVRIKNPEKDPQKQQQQRQKAQDEQKKHNEQQDRNLQQENQDQQKQKEQQSGENARNTKDEQQGAKGAEGENRNQPGQGNQPKSNPEDRQGTDGPSKSDRGNEPKDNPENQPGQGTNGQPKPEPGSEPKNGQDNQPQQDAGGQPKPDQGSGKPGQDQQQSDKQLEEQAKRLREALDGQKGESKNGQQGGNGQPSGAENRPNPQGGAGQQQPAAENRPDPQRNQGQNPETQNNPGRQDNTGQQPNAGSKSDQRNGAGQQPAAQDKAHPQGKADQKPGERTQAEPQGNKGQQPGAEDKPDRQDKGSQQPGAEKNPGQQGDKGQQSNTGEKPNRQGNANPKPETGNQPGAQNNKGQQPDTGKKPDPQNQADRKPDGGANPNQQGGANSKPEAGNQPGRQDQAGQKPDAGDKPDRQGGKGQKPDTENKANPQGGTRPKPDAQDKPGPQGNKGQQPDAGTKPSQPGNETPKPDAGAKSGQQGKTGQEAKAPNKPGQPGNEGQKPDTGNKPDRQGASGQKPGDEKNPGQEGQAAGQKPDGKGKPNQPNSSQKPGSTEKPGQPKSGAGSKGQEKGTGEKNGNDRKPSVEELIQAIKNGDAKVREDAAKKLQDAREKVNNPALKKAIEDALKESKQGQSGQKPGQPGPKSDSGNSKGQAPSPQGDGPKAKQPEQNAQGQNPGSKGGQETKDGQKGDQPKGEEGKAGAKSQNGQQGDGQPQGQGNKEKNGQGGEGAQGQANQGQPENKPGDVGHRPGGGVPQGTPKGPAGGASQPDPKGSEANPLYQQKAGELQLEDFKKRVTKDVIRKANMTEEEYQQFLKAYEKMLKRKQPDPAAKDDKLLDPKSRGGNLGNIGPRRLNAQGKDDKVQRNGAALPPPEYREAYKEFTEKLSGLERK